MPAPNLSTFDRSLAYVIGIDDYIPPIPRLLTARADAESLANCLEANHGYTVHRLTSDVTLGALESLQKQMLTEVTADDRVLFYFAGHGVAPDLEARSGYLLPGSACRDNPK